MTTGTGLTTTINGKKYDLVYKDSNRGRVEKVVSQFAGKGYDVKLFDPNGRGFWYVYARELKPEPKDIGKFGKPKLAKYYGGKKLYSKAPPIVECSCDLCQSMCQNHPCWGTPQEIMKLINMGYGKRLMWDYYWDSSGKFGKKGTEIGIITPATKGHEGGSASFSPIGRCTFLNNKGLCEIHSVKPIEGRIASHACAESSNDKISPMKKLHLSIVNMWATHEGDMVRKAWMKKRGW